MKKMVEQVGNNFESNLYFAFNTENKTSIKSFVEAYNTYQECERECADYIYDMDNKNDLISCIDGGMTLEKLVGLYNTKKTQYFLLPLTYSYTPESLSVEKLLSIILSYKTEIVTNMILYPHHYKSDFYREIVTESLMEIS